MVETFLSPRDRIGRLLEVDPGLHLREVPRRLGLSLRAVRYHLEVLERERRVVAHRTGRFVRWFPAARVERDEFELISAIRVRSQRLVLSALIGREAARFSEIEASTGLRASVLAKCLRTLADGGILVSRPDRRYSLRDPGAVRHRIATYRTRFPDLLADSALEIFEETR